MLNLILYLIVYIGPRPMGSVYDGGSVYGQPFHGGGGGGYGGRLYSDSYPPESGMICRCLRGAS